MLESHQDCKNVRKQRWGRCSHISKAEVEALFHLPLPQAAIELGICTTSAKKLCRKLGIRKWPYCPWKARYAASPESKTDNNHNNSHDSHSSASPSPSSSSSLSFRSTSSVGITTSGLSTPLSPFVGGIPSVPLHIVNSSNMMAPSGLITSAEHSFTHVVQNFGNLGGNPLLNLNSPSYSLPQGLNSYNARPQNAPYLSPQLLNLLLASLIPSQR